MLAKRIIPCLDVKDGKVVKGISFAKLKELGDPLKLAKFYSANGADELVFLDISASQEGRKTFVNLVRQTAAEVAIPFTVGGGISTVDDMRQVLRAGADKVAINTNAILNPALIKEGAEYFGSQCIVVAIDAKWNEDWGDYQVFTHGGNKETSLRAIDWAKEVERLGAGEILLTSIDQDGHRDGFQLDLTKKIGEAVRIPVIASGGAGEIKHFVELFQKTEADAALAASIFHQELVSIAEIKKALRKEGVEVR